MTKGIAVRFSFLALLAAILLYQKANPVRAGEQTPGERSLGSAINPLTGLRVPDPSRLERLPIAVKISNYPRSVRPQFGLSRADIVYEYYLERGATRFVAIYYGQDAEKAGPIRSARFFDEYIFRMYRSLFVFGNADDRVMEHFLSLGKTFIGRFILEKERDRSTPCNPVRPARLCRDAATSGYQNLFANTAALTQDILVHSLERERPVLDGMRFQPIPPPGGQDGLLIDLNYSSMIYGRWLFDEASGKYLRFQDIQDGTAPEKKAYTFLQDGLTGETVSAENIVVLFVPHSFFIKTATTEIIQIHLDGFGEAVVFRDGLAYPAVWAHPVDGLLSLYSPQGGPLPLKPGTTFFQVMGTTSRKSSHQGYWQFDFQPPKESASP